tara:strand:+ start:49613 stop:50989 length:1377 start_codon:yes stop_codon:yes gene_type:complete
MVIQNKLMNRKATMSVTRKLSSIFVLMAITTSTSHAVSEGSLDRLSLKSISGIYTADIYELDHTSLSKWSNEVRQFEAALSSLKSEEDSEVKLSKTIELMKDNHFSNLIGESKGFNEDSVKAKLKEHYKKQLSAAEVNKYAAEKRLAQFMPTYTRIEEGYKRSIRERAELSAKADDLNADFDAAKTIAMDSLNDVDLTSAARKILASYIGDKRFYKTKSYPEKRFGKGDSCYKFAGAKPSVTNVIYSEPLFMDAKSYCASLQLRSQNISKYVDKLGPKQIEKIQNALNKYLIDKKVGGDFRDKRDGYFNDHPDLINIARRFKSAQVDKKMLVNALESFEKKVDMSKPPSEGEINGLLASLLLKIVDDSADNYKLSLLTANLQHVSTMTIDGKFKLGDDNQLNLMVLKGGEAAGVKPYVKIIPTKDMTVSPVKLTMSDLLTLEQLLNLSSEQNQDLRQH